MQKLTLITGLSLLLLTGCAPKSAQRATEPAPVATPEVTAIQVEQPKPQAEDLQVKRMQICRSELDALQVYNKASWNKYNNEFQRLTTRINKYQKVQPSIGADINDIVMPQTEFQMRELCFRIKSRLAQLMIRQM